MLFSFFFFKQKTAYEVRISDWSSDVCSSDLYRRAAARNLERVNQALASPQPLAALWALSTDPARTVLAAEFMALANHRKAIAGEIARNIEHSRELQAAAFARALAANGSLRDRDAAAGFAFLMAGASRALIMEQGVGVAAWPDAARSLESGRAGGGEGGWQRG